MAPKWSDDLNIKFVELYKEHRCLWDQQDELYKNKNARETALASIVESINIQGFGVAEAKAKIKSFRGTFNIEYAKQKKSAKSGSGSADVYIPTLKWFNSMKEVMVKGTLTRDTKSTSIPETSNAPTNTVHLENTVEPASAEDIDEHENDEENSTSLQETQKRGVSPTTSQHQTSVNNQPTKKFKPRSKIQQIAVTARELKNLNDSVSRSSDNGNEWDIYGRHVAAQLKLLSPIQAVTAQMEINNVLTKCRFNDLIGNTTAHDRILSVSTNLCPVPSTTSSSDVYVTSPEIEEALSENIIITTTETPGQSTFSQVFSALGYKQDH